MPETTKRSAEATPHKHGIRKKWLTQEDKVLLHLDTWGSITSMEAFHKYGITRLAAVIFNLKHEGHDIITVMETTSDGKRYGRYMFRNRRTA